MRCTFMLQLIIALLVAINCCYCNCGAALRRTPKVYNALITTDDNLTSSRAFPVIQPTIHESGLAHYPFGAYNPYGFYTPPVVRFGQPIAPGLGPKAQPQPYAYSPSQFPPQFPPQFLRQPPGGLTQNFQGFASPFGPPTAPGQLAQPQEPAPQAPNEQQPVKPPTAPAPQPATLMPAVDANNPEKMPSEQLPIPLNEYGLPASLLPVSQFANRQHNPINLPPYGYRQFPLIYDGLGGFREQYLPPYGYYPSHNAFDSPSGRNPFLPAHPQQQPPTPSPPTLPSTLPPGFGDAATDDGDLYMATEATMATTELANFENIKNGSKSKDSNVPDVPPPPIPSGANSKQS